MKKKQKINMTKLIDRNVEIIMENSTSNHRKKKQKPKSTTTINGIEISKKKKKILKTNMQ